MVAPTISDAALASQLRLSMMRLGRRVRSERADTTHTLSQFAALASIERHGPISPGELAAREKVQPPSMTRIVAALQAEGLISRTPHPHDGRQQLLAITSAGRELLETDRRRREEWLAHRLQDLSPEERAALAAVLPLLDRLADT